MIQCDELSELKEIVKKLQSEQSILSDELTKLKNNGYCGDNWISYSDDKCLQVLDRIGTEIEAKANCSELDSTSTLIRIANQDEQDFLNRYLKDFNNISDNVWIGLEWINNGFKWIDDTKLNYQNWGKNANNNGINKCVLMSLSQSERGKWTDDPCDRKYLIACQKQQVNNKYLNDQVKHLKKIVNDQQREIDQNKGNFNNLHSVDLA